MWDLGFSDENEANTSSSEPRTKRIKRYPSVFKREWILKYSWVTKGRTNHHCRCTSCNSEFSVAHGGEHDVRKHMNTEKHKQSSQSTPESKITSLLSDLSETKIKQVAVAEGTCNYLDCPRPLTCQKLVRVKKSHYCIHFVAVKRTP